MNIGRVVTKRLPGAVGLTLFPVLVFAGLTGGVDTHIAQGQTVPAAGRPVPALQEVAWSFRTLPVDASVVDPTAFCAAAPTGFPVTLTQGYSLYTYKSDERSGHVTEFLTSHHVGRVMSCLGAVINADDGTRYQKFYGRIAMDSGEKFEGLGKCDIIYGGSPEAGTSQLVCSLKLTIVPAGYTTGILVGNTLSLASYARGYNASSLATLRAFRSVAR